MTGTTPTILAFDTSAAHCAAAVLQNGHIIADRVEPMKRGQAERLVPLLEELLAESELAWKDLTHLAVGIGPGNFTGIRISVAAARGLALGLNIPAIGVSSFEVMAAGSPDAATRQVISIEAPRDTAYLQTFEDGVPMGDPVLTAFDGAIDTADVQIIGHRASDLGALFIDAVLEDVPARIARCAQTRVAKAETFGRPKPLYVRPADAAPSRDAPPVILP